MNIIELAKEAGFETCGTTGKLFNKDLEGYCHEELERFAAIVRAEREWVDLTDDDRNDIETNVCAHIDSHDFELIGNAYIAAFKEKNK